MSRASIPQGEWLTITEAAQYLRVSRDTIYRWAKQGKLPLYKVGGTATRVRKRDLDVLATPKTPPPDPWTQLSAPAFEADWDNPEDAIYDDWQRLYGLSKG
jgi:excisionase family DNA binding protein